MAKSVLDTVREYAQDIEARERLATASVELELCDRMVELRERAGMTQQDLADKMHCSQAYIAKLENGAYDKCTIGTLHRFARALGHDINVDLLFVAITPAVNGDNLWQSCVRATSSHLRVIDGKRAA